MVDEESFGSHPTRMLETERAFLGGIIALLEVTREYDSTIQYSLYVLIDRLHKKLKEFSRFTTINIF
jgi:hypothetical protein